jgi:hypothetical protein
MDPSAVLVLASTTLGSRFLSLVVAILTKRYLFGLAVLGFTGSGVVMLVTSAFVPSGGWWQNVLVEIGAGLLFVGLVDLAILGALRRVIDPDEGRRVTVQRGEGPKIILTGADDATLAWAMNGVDYPTSQELAAQVPGLTAAIQRLESTINPPPA